MKDSTLRKNLGKRIQRARKEMGISQRKLAEMLKVSQPTVWCWENGQKFPSIPMIWRMMKIGIYVLAKL